MDARGNSLANKVAEKVASLSTPMMALISPSPIGLDTPWMKILGQENKASL